MDFEGLMRKACKDISNYGEEFAKYRPIANNLYELRKTILSSEMVKNEGKSMAEKEMLGRTSKEYITHIDGWTAAEQKAMTAYAKLEAAKARFDALRSLCSLEKKAIETFEYQPKGE